MIDTAESFFGFEFPRLSTDGFVQPDKRDAARPGRPTLTTAPTSGNAPESSMALLLRAKGGDEAALNDLCARYLPRVERWARGRLPPWARGAVDTQDLAQMTIVKVARNVGTFVPRHEAAFQVYVRSALLRVVLDQIKAAIRKPSPGPLAADRPSLEPSPLEGAIGRELLERYDAALARLKNSDREAIVARVEMDLTWAEVAEALGKNSAAAAQVAVTRALVRLAKEMSLERRA